MTDRAWGAAARRLSHPLAWAVTGLMVLATVGVLLVIIPRVQEHPVTWGLDFHLYLDYAQRWLDGKGFYLDWQLAGPYEVSPLYPPLYPPTFLWLIVPFLWLPQLLWWVIPLGIMAWQVAWFRPSPWAWAGIMACIAWPRTIEIVIQGNPSMWTAAFAAAGTIWAWPAVWVLLKPSLFPFAAIGIRHRSWWISHAIFIAMSLPFGAMWLDYVTVLRNADQGVLYSLRDVPIVLLAVIAWVGATRHKPQRRL